MIVNKARTPAHFKPPGENIRRTSGASRSNRSTRSSRNTRKDCRNVGRNGGVRNTTTTSIGCCLSHCHLRGVTARIEKNSAANVSQISQFPTAAIVFHGALALDCSIRITGMTSSAAIRTGHSQNFVRRLLRSSTIISNLVSGRIRS